MALSRFPKAFDTIDHTMLLHKLAFHGISGSCTYYPWYCSYLSNKKQVVIYNGTRPDNISSVCGVSQGSILGPLLFHLYINNP